ncbi:Retrovirus Polyprotein [Phytophthora palmivora]|uniref:Retrovirus Polyprotein n=1 Tax=Phytophthora palmivora TaxID=4796 RepID=A0A2P4YND9_9STRA|nr:Retrovirus Polyprotein [Phytophthora palmivora]
MKPFAVLARRDAVYTIDLPKSLATHHMSYVERLSSPLRTEAELPGQPEQPVSEPVKKQSVGEQIETLLASAPHHEESSIAQAERRQMEILDADYKKEPLEEHVPDYLSESEQVDLLKLLTKFEPTVFSGKVGSWKGEPYEIPTKPNLVPYHGKPYPIPHSLLETTKKEIARLEKLKIIAKCERSPWAAPSFIIPKANKTVRTLCDLRRLNAQLDRHPWPLPKINELFRSIPRFVFVTVMDLNMGYYAIHLTLHSPFWEVHLVASTHNISTAPDHFQARIDKLLGDLPFVRCYLDDVLVVTETSFAEHLQQLKVVLLRLEGAGLTVNVKKCKFAAKEANYLGYRMTNEGISSQPEKIQAIQRISPPSNKKELHRFIGLVNYYRDVWPQRAHLPAPLTRLTSKLVPWEWSIEHQTAFDQLKASMQRSTLLHFPDYNLPFEVYTDASSYQLGGVVSQDGKPLAFYSRKLTAAQKNYSVMEQELLSIVEILKEFRTMLFGQRITVFTDHKNLSCSNFTSGRVMRWRLIIEEFGPIIRYIKGAVNTAADALSRLPQTTGHDDGDQECNVLHEQFYPLTHEQLAQAQHEDETLQTALAQKPQLFQSKSFGNYTVLQSKAGQLIIPVVLRSAVMNFYHESLLHPGMNRMFLTMSNAVYWPGIRRAVEAYVRVCATCQKWKRSPKQYGRLPEKIHGRERWTDVAVDEIGPYSYSDEPNAPKLYALTMIKLATHWIEIAPVPDATAKSAAMALDEFWLCRYPRPLRIVHDQGKEFFQEMLESYGVKSKPTTVKTPQANAVLERVHQVIGNMVRTNRLDQQLWTEVLPSVAFAIRATVHTTLCASPAQLVFQRDMIADTVFTAHWATIYSRQQRQTRRENERENRARLNHSYKVGDLVLLLKSIRNLPKLAQPTEGPFPITAVHSNDTLTVDRGNYEETINSRRVKPYFRDQA